MIRALLLLPVVACIGVAEAQIEGRVDEQTCTLYRTYAAAAANGFAELRGAQVQDANGFRAYESTQPLMSHHHCVITTGHPGDKSQAMCVTPLTSDKRPLTPLFLMGEELPIRECLPQLERLERLHRTEAGEEFAYVSKEGAQDPFYVVVGVRDMDVVVDAEATNVTAIYVRFGQGAVERTRADRFPFSITNLIVPFPLSLFPWGATAPAEVVDFFEQDGGE